MTTHTSVHSAHLDGCFQLLGQLLDAEETSLLQDAWKRAGNSSSQVGLERAGDSGRRGDLTSDVDPLVDDELAVPQVVEDGLKVFRAAVNEEGAALVPRVAPHVWSDINRISFDNTIQ